MIIIPFKGFHAARVSDPANYKKIVTKDLGDGIQLLLGINDESDESKTEAQSYHFDSDKWTPKEVRKWLKEHDIKPIELTMAKKTPVDSDVKENSIVTHNGEIIGEHVPIDRIPEKTFGNVRQQDIPQLLDNELRGSENLHIETPNNVELEKVLPDQSNLSDEVIDADFTEESELPVDAIEGSEPESDNWDPVEAKSDMIEWARDDTGKISKKSLMKWYLDVDAGDGQDPDSYRYQVGAVVNGEPHYCHKALDFSWELASGNQTGIANRNIMKKIIFIKNREDMPLTEDQLDFTERHMEAYKQNANCPDSEKSGTGPGSCGGGKSKSSKIAGNISFKKDIDTGKYRSFEPESHVIKIGGKEVGSISEISNMGRRVDDESGKFAVRIMVKKEVTSNDKSPFKWQTFKKKFDTANDAKTWLKDNIEHIKKIDLYQMQDSAPLIPISMKLNYNCSDDIKNGEGTGSCSSYYSMTKGTKSQIDYLDTNIMILKSIEKNIVEHPDEAIKILDSIISQFKDTESDESHKLSIMSLRKELANGKIDVAKSTTKEWINQLSNKRDSLSVRKQNEVFLDDEHSPGGLDIVVKDEIKMNSSPAGSKIIYEDDSVIDVPVVPMREGIFTGTDGIPTLKKFEYFGKDAHWLEGQPILRGHTAPTELVTYKHNRIGKLMNVIARPDKKDVVAIARYYKDKISPDDLSRIKSGVPYDGSIAYTTHTSMTSGDFNGQKYNAIEDGGYHFYHFAELPTGIGACSTKDGCGFMLNERGYEPKIFYNDKRRAEVTHDDQIYAIKLNSSLGGQGTLFADNEQDAITWSKTYVKSGLIPIGMKLNYNDCHEPDNGRFCSGEGSGVEGETGGSYSPLVMRSKATSIAVPQGKGGRSGLHDAHSTFQNVVKSLVTSGRKRDADVFKQRVLGKYNTPDSAKKGQNEWRAMQDLSRGEGISAEELHSKIRDVAKDYGVSIRKTSDDKLHIGRFSVKNKQNSQFYNSQNNLGNNMTNEEFIQADDTIDVDVMKLNEDFEQKLNERDAQIAELTAQVDELVQKQNEAEQTIIDARAAADFEAFTMKLNKAHQKDAQVHYDGFKAEGWAYLGAHPEIFQIGIPKMNARGSPANEGDNATALLQAREMLKKSQKEMSSKRVR